MASHGPEAIKRIAVCDRTSCSQIGEDLMRTVERFRQRGIVFMLGAGHAGILGRVAQSQVILSASAAITRADACALARRIERPQKGTKRTQSKRGIEA